MDRFQPRTDKPVHKVDKFKGNHLAISVTHKYEYYNASRLHNHTAH